MIIKEAKLVVDLLEEHKVEAVEAIAVKALTPFASYYVLGTCANPRQLQAAAELVGDLLEEKGYEPKKPEGDSSSGWVLVDAGEVIVHLFTESMRKTIGLEALLSGRKAK